LSILIDVTAAAALMVIASRCFALIQPQQISAAK
jgi:hypothetical protein